MFTKIVTNPTAELVEEAVELFTPVYNKETFLLIAIGGGSPIDAAKAASVLLHHKIDLKQDVDCYKLFKFEFKPVDRSNLFVIDTTAGTGTSVDMFSVVSLLDTKRSGLQYASKPALADPVIYPDCTVLDPDFLPKGKPNLIRFPAIDACNHCMEAITTSITCPYAATLAREVFFLVDRYLPRVLESDDRRGRYWLVYAACIAGQAFDNSLLHLTHAAEHTLSSLKPDLAHGRGLALIQAAVLKAIWPSSKTTLADVMKPLLGDITDKATPKEAFHALRKWFVKVGFNETLYDIGFKLEDVDMLVEATRKCPGMEGLLAICPMKCDDEVIRTMFKESFEKQ